MKKENLKAVGAHDCAQRGITLIALVITIIVMLILVAVTISMAVNGGLFDYAGKAVSETNNALKAEGKLADGGIEIGGVWYNNIDEYLNNDKVKTIPTTTSYVGCYADVDGNGTVDGVIYADLAFSKEGTWSYGYSYEAVAAEELKDYYVSGTADGAFGDGVEVLTATGEGKDRFYVMALSDISTSSYTWYESKSEDGITVSTSEDFGTGKANTETMIEIWNADTDEEKSSNDIWGQIRTLVSKGWFIPSTAEWDAFADAFDISVEIDWDAVTHFIPFGLSDLYWSSSQYSAEEVWFLYLWDENYFEDQLMVTWPRGLTYTYVRLSTTF